MIQVMYGRSGRSAMHNNRRFTGGDTGDTHHLVDSETMRTLCGRNAADWFDMTDAFEAPSQAAESVWCCQRCAARSEKGDT